MPLMRKRSEEQLKKLRNTVKKSGGDIGDKTTKDFNTIPNAMYIHNPADIKLNTYDDEHKKNLKHLKSYEDYEFPRGVLQIPDFYLKQWLSIYYDYCDEYDKVPEYDSLDELRGNKHAISVVYDYAKKYKEERHQFLDGHEFMEDFFLKESNEIDLLRIGKGTGVNFNGKLGEILKIDKDLIIIQTVAGEMVKMSLVDFIKKYKK